MGAVAFAGLIALSIILLRTLRARKVQRQADQASTAQGKLNLSSSAWHRHACIFLQPCFHTSCNWRGRCRVLPCLQLCTLQCPIARKHSLTHSLTHPHMFAGPGPSVTTSASFADGKPILPVLGVSMPQPAPPAPKPRRRGSGRTSLDSIDDAPRLGSPGIESVHADGAAEGTRPPSRPGSPPPVNPFGDASPAMWPSGIGVPDTSPRLRNCRTTGDASTSRDGSQ